jgi:hypothetical protein
MRPLTLSEPIPANQYWPNTFNLWWITGQGDDKRIAHTECAASFGEKESNREENQTDALKASETFNSLPEKERTHDTARRIVQENHGDYVFDLWLSQVNYNPRPKISR